MNSKLRVFYVSTEASPFVRFGDLAETARALSGSLASLGVEISLVLPKLRRPEIEALGLDVVLPELVVPLGADKVKASVYKTEAGNIPAYFIENHKYFYRDEIYGSPKEDYLDNDERFTFYCRAALEFFLKAKISADIIHCNNWPTALIPLFLKTHYAQKTHFRDTATVLTLHNPAQQGQFPPESLVLTGLTWDYFTPDQLALNGKFNFLKAGLIFADVFNGLSPACRAALQSGDGGGGFESILSRRRDSFFVVPNGTDDATWKRAAGEYLDLYMKALAIKRGG